MIFDVIFGGTSAILQQNHPFVWWWVWFKKVGIWSCLSFRGIAIKETTREFLFLNNFCDLLHLDLNHQVVTGLLGLANCAFGCYAAFKEVNIQVVLLTVFLLSLIDVIGY